MSTTAETIAAAVPAITSATIFAKKKKSSALEFFCTCCQCELSADPRIECAECPPGRVHLCLGCFSRGYSGGGHAASHDYRVAQNLNFQVFKNCDWTAHEEMTLLDGIDKFGFGNWEDIAHELGDKRRPMDYAEHYDNYYVHGVSEIPRITETPEEAYQRTVGERNLKRASANLSRLPGAHLAGFMPLRRDFDVQFRNDAEKVIAHLAFQEDDAPHVRHLKSLVLMAYNRTVDERERRKHFILDRGLLDWQRHESQLSKKPKHEATLRRSMRPYERFLEPEQSEELVHGLLRERELRLQIEQLKQYQLHGLHTVAQVRQFTGVKNLKYKQSRGGSSSSSSSSSSKSKSKSTSRKRRLVETSRDTEVVPPPFSGKSSNRSNLPNQGAVRKNKEENIQNGNAAGQYSTAQVAPASAPAVAGPTGALDTLKFVTGFLREVDQMTLQSIVHNQLPDLGSEHLQQVVQVLQHAAAADSLLPKEQRERGGADSAYPALAAGEDSDATIGCIGSGDGTNDGAAAVSSSPESPFNRTGHSPTLLETSHPATERKSPKVVGSRDPNRGGNDMHSLPVADATITA